MGGKEADEEDAWENGDMSLAPIASKVLMKVLYGARMARFDFLRPTSLVEAPELPACQPYSSKSPSKLPKLHLVSVPDLAQYSHSASSVHPSCLNFCLIVAAKVPVFVVHLGPSPSPLRPPPS